MLLPKPFKRRDPAPKSPEIWRMSAYYAHLLLEYPWRSRSDGERFSGDLGSTGPVPS
jgi:hypothetical protein